MANSVFSSGKNSIAECDYCAFRCKLNELRALVVKGIITGIKVCPACYEKDHPQLFLGTFPVDDAQAARDPRRDNSYYGPWSSRNIQWNWNPVGGPRDGGATKSTLIGTGAVGNVSVVIS